MTTTTRTQATGVRTRASSLTLTPVRSGNPGKKKRVQRKSDTADSSDDDDGSDHTVTHALATKQRAERHSPATGHVRRTVWHIPTTAVKAADGAPGETPDMTTMAVALERLSTVVASLQDANAPGNQLEEASPKSRSRSRSRTTLRRRSSTRGSHSRRRSTTPSVPPTPTTMTGSAVAPTPAPPEMAAMAAALQQLTAQVTDLQARPTAAMRGSRTQRSRRDRRGRRAATPSSSGSSSSSSSDSSSSDESSSSDSSSDGGGSSEGDGGDGRRSGRHVRHNRHGLNGRPRRPSVKDLELPAYIPSPSVSVSTWIDRIDLILKGAEESGRGKWSNRSLYFIIGNKLMEDAARWWVNLNRRLEPRKQTWKYLKKALLRRYGERLDKSVAEWRVNSRVMMPGETYADFAAGLRQAAGRNHVSERVFLAQFYRCLDKTTRKLVLQRQKPKTLEKAVEKATKIDDPYENVAQGMVNIGQQWTTAPTSYLIPVAGSMGQTAVIPGIGSMALPMDLTNNVTTSVAVEQDTGAVALFTNPQGVWNNYSGTWEKPPGRAWNGKYWEEAKKKGPKRKAPATPVPQQQRESKKLAVPKMKARRESDESSDDEVFGQPKVKKFKAAVKTTGAPAKPAFQRSSGGRTGSTGPNSVGRSASGTINCFLCGKEGHWANACPTGPQCYACRKWGHIARDCPDKDAKDQNDAYLKAKESKKAESKEN